MFRIQHLNRIAAEGLELLSRKKYEIASDLADPDAILVRSHDMMQMELSPSLKAIARAGIGVNNIPVERCTQKGIVVFNTPGANANSVKELVLASLFIASRRIFTGASWVRTLVDKGEEVPRLVEKEKGRFAGPEIRGKRLGVIGLGAVGVMVANDATALGMEVTGYDPFISVESAWGLSRNVKRAPSLEALLSDSDYITLHVPLNEQTRGIIDRSRLSRMKKGVRLLNFARGGLVNNEDLIRAIKEGIVSAYVTDFPEEKLIGLEEVIPIPHLGASTPEAEQNCAVMAAQQLIEFLEKGNISNSVNFPTCETPMAGSERLIIANRNIPNMVGQITTLLAEEMVNISDMINRHRDDLAYNIIDVDQKVAPGTLGKIGEIEGVLMVRSI